MTEEPIELFKGHEPNPSKHRFPDLSYLAEELDLNGYFVVPDRLTPSQLDELRTEIDRLLEVEEREFGEENLRRINDCGVVRSPFLSSQGVRDACFDSLVFDALDLVFGKQRVLHVNRAVVNDPSQKHPAAVWHREPAYVDFTASRPLSLTCIQMIDPSNDMNGGIEMLVGSHRWPRFPSDEFVRRNAVVPSIPAGSLLVFNSLLFHRNTANQTNDLRRSLVTIFTTPVIKQQVNIPQMMRDRQCESIADQLPDGRFLFGFDTELRQNDDDYRRSKLHQIK
ncbi:MAG: hypothetical protein CMM61_14160 [Rhodospirillaceae bacterium]|nr:hypothetical protein [Rhodospirillaceae bacterium]|tara:strand:+ start:291 stop:1133 length:843 start_codon:yes stop_codon:yes gene_type:complete